MGVLVGRIDNIPYFLVFLDKVVLKSAHLLDNLMLVK